MRETTPTSDLNFDPTVFLPPITGYEHEPVLPLEEATKELRPSIVPEIEDMVHRAKRNCRNPKDGLSQDESASIMLYSMEWTPSEKSFFHIFNEAMRAKDRKRLIPWFRYIRLMVEALSKLPERQPRLLYRGIKSDQSKSYQTGEEVIWWPFSSCTESLATVTQFLGNSGHRTLFNIRCQLAVDIREHTLFKDEGEMLLYPGREFRVLSSTTVDETLHIVDLEEIVPKYPNFYFPEKPRLPPPSPPSPPTINIVLVGPTGVGKATFINALVNYLKYPQLQQALRSDVQVLIPLSFVYGNPSQGFEGIQVVRLGQGSREERPRDCRTYTVDMNERNGKKLCLIDTPSFGDHIEPEENLRAILNYMKTLTHINAVCFILKPDETSLGQFSTYFRRILDALGPDSHQNIIFAFTFIRRTLFTLGHSAPLLSQMFQSLGMNNLSLQRQKNVFLFENNAFRYLMLQKQGIQLDATADAMYTEQWRKGVGEANQLFQSVEKLPRRTLNR